MSSEESTLERAARLHPDHNLGAFFRGTAARNRERVALLEHAPHGAWVLTYGALEERICKAVAGLRQAGLARNDRLAIALPNCIDYLVAFLAAMRLGALPVLVNFRLNSDTVRFVLEDSRSSAILTDAIEQTTVTALAEAMPLRVRLSISAAPGWQHWATLIESWPPDTHVERMASDAQAFQPYTAGSTGLPKGILLTHAGMLWGIEHSQRHWPVDPTTRNIVAAPMYHKNAMRGVLKPTLRAGGSVVILGQFDNTSYLHALAQHRVTACGGVPAMFAQILQEQDLLRTLDLSALRLISMGSSTVPDELVNRLKATFPGAKIKETYGLTEGGGPLGPPAEVPTPHGSVGRVAPEVEVQLVDADGKVDPRHGELWLRSPYVLKEYVNRPDLTRERLQDGWLKTGDLFRVDEAGFYYFVGRIDDMFVCGGENTYPKEVEQLILGHPDVIDAIVVPLPHETKGYAPAALLQLRQGRTVASSEIQQFCADRGPSHTIPRAVLMVEHLPMTGAGKPDRKAAITMLQEKFGTLISSGRRTGP